MLGSNLGTKFDLKPLADALAERGRVVVRRAYADWSLFDDDRRMLTREHVELIEIPQRMGTSRKNAADIKLAVDAIELSFERDYLTTFVIGTGDSDFTPLVHKLREMNKRVIGVGVEGLDIGVAPAGLRRVHLLRDAGRRRGLRAGREKAPPAERRPTRPEVEPSEEPAGNGEVVAAARRGRHGHRDHPDHRRPGQRHRGPVLASSVKRTLLRKDPTFNEADYGFRAFGEMLRAPRRRAAWSS